MTDKDYMALALIEARKAFDIKDVPVGAVIVKNGEVIATGYNTRENKQNATHHAEMIAINNACEKLGTWRLDDCTIYVTLEPCPMCTGAIINSRIKRIVFGALDYKAGCCGSVINLCAMPFNHCPDMTSGVLESECLDILQDFFKSIRDK